VLIKRRRGVSRIDRCKNNPEAAHAASGESYITRPAAAATRLRVATSPVSASAHRSQ
jgi:hypothetical protein